MILKHHPLYYLDEHQEIFNCALVITPKPSDWITRNFRPIT